MSEHSLPVVKHQEAKKQHRPRLGIDPLSFLPHSTGQSKSQGQLKYHLLMEQLGSRTEKDEDTRKANSWDHFCSWFTTIIIWLKACFWLNPVLLTCKIRIIVVPYLKGLIVHAKGLAYLNFLENVSHDDADPALRGLSSLKICICMQERVSCFFVALQGRTLALISPLYFTMFQLNPFWLWDRNPLISSITEAKATVCPCRPTPSFPSLTVL